MKSSIPYVEPNTENVLKFIKDGLRRNSNEVIIINGTDGIHWTGHQLEKAIGRVAKFLINECGIRKGDVVSVFEKDHDRVAIVLLSIIVSGATCKLISSTIKDVASTIQVSHAKLVITSKDNILPLKNELTANGLNSIKFVSLDDTHDGSSSISMHLQSTNETVGLTLDELIELVPIVPEEDIAVIQFSSGTTGKPKRIPRTHKNLCHLAVAVDHPELMFMKPGVKIAGYLPLGFRPGLWTLLACINSGTTFIIKYPVNLDSLLEVVDKYKATICSLSVLAMTQLSNAISQKCKQYDLSSVKDVLTAGAKIVNFDVAQRIVDEMKLESFRQSFGMTESGWVFLLEKSLSKNQYLTIGHVVPGMEAIVIDPKTGQKLGPNERGEIALRGPQIFPGYMTDQKGVYNREDFTDDGWFKIGDEAYYTEEGLFYIVGRYKELLFVSSGRRFYPDQAEAVLLQNDDIETCCVVNMKSNNDDLFDIARAYVTVKHGSSIKDSDIIDYLKENAPLYVLDGGVRIIDTFPRFANGKINKNALKMMP